MNIIQAHAFDEMLEVLGPEPQIRLTIKRRTIGAAGGLVEIGKNGTPAAAAPCDWDEIKSDHAILGASAKMAYPFAVTIEL